MKEYIILYTPCVIFTKTIRASIRRAYACNVEDPKYIAVYRTLNATRIVNIKEKNKCILMIEF